MFGIDIKFKRIHKNAVIPKQESKGAACMDLVITEIEQLDEEKVIVKFGFATAIPEGFKVVMAPRSSFTHKGWILANSPCQIDSDYRGEWIAKFDAIPINYNSYIRYRDGTENNYGMQYPEFPYKVGDRILQCWVEEVVDCEFTEVDSLDETERGEGGFGSTDIMIGNEKQKWGTGKTDIV